MAPAEDVVDVRLTKRGEELGGCVVAGGDYHYEFRPGADAQRMTRSEFHARCQRARDAEDVALL